MKKPIDLKRIETKLEIQTYLAKIVYAIQSNTVVISFQKDRNVDRHRTNKHTNRYTMGKLFPNEDEVDVLKRELLCLSIEEYIETVKDIRFPKKSELRVFMKQYAGEDAYIKIRVELVNTDHAYGNSFIMVMSFHFSERRFKENDFPYKKECGDI